MTDLVERLRLLSFHEAGEAADEIGRLEKLADINADEIQEYQQEIERLQKRNALLEDVAVAAERANEYIRDLHGLQYGPHYLEKTLDKLRGVSDE